MSFKDALNKSAEAATKKNQKQDSKKVSNTSKKEDKVAKETSQEETKRTGNNIKSHSESLLDVLSENELRDISNRKSLQSYPTIHKMIGLACNKMDTDVITYVNEAIVAKLRKDGIIELYELVHGSTK